MDHEPQDKLSVDIWALLEVNHPQHWLPFVEDKYLDSWRDYLVSQLRPGGKVETIEIFAGRLGLNPADFEDLLSSDTSLQDNIFTHLPMERLVNYRALLVADNITLIENYLG
jgi:hypothetical protein